MITNHCRVYVLLRRGSMVQLGWLGTLLSKLRYRHADSRSWAHYKRTNLCKSDADRKLSRLGQLLASVIRHRALPRFEKWLTSEYSLLNDIFSWRFMVKLGSVGDMLYQLWSRCTISLTYTQWWHTVLREFNRHRKLSRWGLPRLEKLLISPFLSLNAIFSGRILVRLGNVGIMLYQ